jgi:hypothetical protein
MDGFRAPKELVKASLMKSKRIAIERLQSQLSTLEWQASQRRTELDSRRAEFKRRCEHVRDLQLLYETALGQVNGTGLETLVDRMVHQVPKQ